MKTPLVRGFLCALAFLVFVLAFVPLRYATNDDPGLLSVLNGADGYGPDAFAVFNGFFLNQALFHLYRLLPNIPWWGLSLYAALTAATALIFGLLFRSGRTSTPALPALLYFLGLCFAYAGITSATLLLLVAVLLWLHAMSLSRDPFPFLFSIGLTVCLAAALMMRWQIALFFLVFALPLLPGARGPALKRILLIPLAACAVLYADRLAFTVTATAQEREFLDHNALRARFHDTPAGDFHPGVTERALKAAGWTREDYDFFHSWNIYDDSLFSAAKVETFLQANSVSGDFPRGIREGARRIAENVWAAKKNLTLLLLALLGLPAGTRAGWNPRGRWTSWLLPLSCLPAAFFFAHYRFVERVYIPLFVLAGVATILSLGNAPATLSRGRKLLLALQIIAVLFLSVRQVDALRKEHREATFVSECLRKTGAATFALLDPATGLGLEKIHPLRERAVPPGSAIFPEGFWVASPRYRRILDSLGFSDGRRFLRGAVGSPNLDWVLLENASTLPAKSAEETLAAWEGYYRRHLGMSMRLLPTTSCSEPEGPSLRFYRMTAAP